MSHATGNRSLAALAALAIAAMPVSKHAEAIQPSRRMFGRSRPNRRSQEEYVMLAQSRQQIRGAPGSQAMHRMRREYERDVAAKVAP